MRNIISQQLQHKLIRQVVSKSRKISMFTTCSKLIQMSLNYLNLVLLVYLLLDNRNQTSKKEEMKTLTKLRYRWNKTVSSKHFAVYF